MAWHQRLLTIVVAFIVSAASAISLAGAAEPIPAQLTARIDSIEFTGERLDEALARVAKDQKLALDVQWKDLAELGITPDTRVQLKLRNVSVGRGLHALLSSPDARVQVLDDGHVLITSKAQLYKRHTTDRRYDISFLLKDANDEAALREQEESLAQTIRDTVCGESWSNENSVHIKPDADGLMIAQTEQNHRAIAALLERLHEQRAANRMNAEEVAAAADVHPWLNQKIDNLAFHGTPLDEAIELLGKASGRSIFVNWKALEAIRVVKTLPVTSDLSNLTVQQALNKLTADIGGSQARVSYAIQEGRVVISSGPDLAMNVATRVYDIRAGIRNEDTRAAGLAAIINRVCGIDPLSWRDAGGRVGQVRELAGQLIITQSPDVHRRIAEELKEILP